MKDWAKAGLIGFILGFVGLWIIMFFTGHDSGGWKCATISGPQYCEFLKFIFAPLHWGFVFLFSWIGFFGGVIDNRLINKILEKRGDERKIPLKVASIITSTIIVVFGLIGILAFEDWVKTMIYAIIFYLFANLVSWAIGKYRY